MKTEQLTEKQAIFQATFRSELVESIRERLNLFYRDYSIESIDQLSKEDYVYGRFYIDGKKTFCYWMEKELGDFGLIAGSPCSQYGVWYGTRGKDSEVKYRNTGKYGNSPDTALENIKKLIKELYKCGEIDDYKGIAKNIIADKYKGKLLATYFPDKYLSIYADFYLNDIMRYFNLDEGISNREPAILKQLKLLKWKKGDEVMRHWDLPKFAMFINREMYLYFYPPKKTKIVVENYVPNFPELTDLNIVFQTFDIDLDFNGNKIEKRKGHDLSKTDYVKKSIRNIAVGNRGEQIVREFERYKLRNFPDLCKKVDWLSVRTDGQGYDIASFELDGTPMQIEVKSTTKPFLGKAEFFLTEFERSIASDLPNYYLYYVSEVASESPKIWAIKAPFHTDQKGVLLTPMSYFVEVIKKK